MVNSDNLEWSVRVNESSSQPLSGEAQGSSPQSSKACSKDDKDNDHDRCYFMAIPEEKGLTEPSPKHHCWWCICGLICVLILIVLILVLGASRDGMNGSNRLVTETSQTVVTDLETTTDEDVNVFAAEGDAKVRSTDRQDFAAMSIPKGGKGVIRGEGTYTIVFSNAPNTVWIVHIMYMKSHVVRIDNRPIMPSNNVSLHLLCLDDPTLVSIAVNQDTLMYQNGQVVTYNTEGVYAFSFRNRKGYRRKLNYAIDLHVAFSFTLVG